MSERVPISTTGRRWLEWKPAQVLPASPRGEATKPSEPGFVGFDGSQFAKSPETDSISRPRRLARAAAVLNRSGVRIMRLDGVTTIGVWSNLDGPGIRKSLRTLGLERLPFRYLDAPNMPARYKVRSFDGEPVPLSVLAEMEHALIEPWTIRDRALLEMRWYPKPTSWKRWKSDALKQIVFEFEKLSPPDAEATTEEP